MRFWIILWTAVWYVSLTVFSLLSVLIAIRGAGDLIALLTRLKLRHTQRPLDGPRDSSPPAP